ncbi:MAG TPA: substrate-binding domain-containing protein [Pirellulaceae bacterium]|nr:substrate-binding domain-containing protein [Pirellulaceae bacterium]HMO91221.1 substrate-binding domain-containing protein [Pirellulaceae bacterium]HMP68595.1 substrate-binding domain-containing protein [Pirellulaceae bacterium]
MNFSTRNFWFAIAGFPYWVAILLVFSFVFFDRMGNAQQTQGQSVSASQAIPNAEARAAEKVMSILKSIDPYHPKAELSGEFAVFGSTTMNSLANQWVQGFNKFHVNANCELSTLKGEDALKHLVSQPSGVVLLSRPVKPEEFEWLKGQGLKDPMQFEVGREALAVFVHDSNPLSAVNAEQFMTVFTTDGGDAITWGALGLVDAWAAKPVHLISRGDKSNVQTFLRDNLLVGKTLRSGKTVHDSNADLLAAIAADPTAIGISCLRASMSQCKPLALTDGHTTIPCDDYSVLTGEYPLVRPIMLVIDAGQTGEQSQLAKEFVKFAICQEGQRKTILAGFFPIDVPLSRAQLKYLDE